MAPTNNLLKERNRTLRLTMGHINPNKGVWTTKEAQDQALATVLQRQRLSKYGRFGRKKEPHTVETLRHLLMEMSNRYFSRAPGITKGIMGVFRHGIDVFRESFQEEMGWEMDDDSEGEDEASEDAQSILRKARTRKEEENAQATRAAVNNNPSGKRRANEMDGANAMSAQRPPEKRAKVAGEAMVVSDPTVSGSTGMVKPAAVVNDTDSSLSSQSRPDTSRATPNDGLRDGAETMPFNPRNGSPKRKSIDVDIVEPQRGSDELNRPERKKQKTLHEAAPAQVVTAGPASHKPSNVMGLNPPSKTNQLSAPTMHNSSAATELDHDRGAISNPKPVIQNDATEGQNTQRNTVEEAQRPKLLKDKQPQRDLPAVAAQDVHPSRQGGRQKQRPPPGSFEGQSGHEVGKAMENLRWEVQQMVQRFCTRNNYDSTVPSEFADHPPEGLAALYAMLFGSKDWKAALLELQNSEQPFQHSVAEAMCAMIGAGLYKSVFQTTTPWQAERDAGSAFGITTESLRAALGDYGVALENVKMQGGFNDISSEAFQKATVVPYGNRLADDLAKTITPHLLALKAAQNPGSESYHCRFPATSHDTAWIDQLRKVFKAALIMKTKLDIDYHVQYTYVWAQRGHTPEPDTAQMASGMHAGSEIRAATWPGIRAVYPEPWEPKFAYLPVVIQK